MNNHKNKCFTLGSYLSEPKFVKIWQILPKIASTLSIGQNLMKPILSVKTYTKVCDPINYSVTAVRIVL